MASIQIMVTQDHIDHGIAGNCFHCPIALAINERLAPGFKARVTVSKIWICQGYDPKLMSAMFFPDEILKTVQPAPYSVNLFIRRFDMAFKPSPFSFRLDIPSEYLRPEESCR